MNQRFAQRRRKGFKGKESVRKTGSRIIRRISIQQKEQSKGIGLAVAWQRQSQSGKKPDPAQIDDLADIAVIAVPGREAFGNGRSFLS